MPKICSSSRLPPTPSLFVFIQPWEPAAATGGGGSGGGGGGADSAGGADASSKGKSDSGQDS